MIMKTQIWTNESLSKYCQFILGYPIKVVYIPKSITNGAMVAFPLYRTLVRSCNKFPRSLVWHECGHLDNSYCLYEILNTVAKKELTIKHIKENLSNYININKNDCNSKRSKREFENHVVSETEAHVWAYKKAINKKYFNIAEEIIECMDYCDFDCYDIYKEAKRRILIHKDRIDKKYLI